MLENVEANVKHVKIAFRKAKNNQVGNSAVDERSIEWTSMSIAIICSLRQFFVHILSTLSNSVLFVWEGNQFERQSIEWREIVATWTLQQQQPEGK